MTTKQILYAAAASALFAASLMLAAFAERTSPGRFQASTKPSGGVTTNPPGHSRRPPPASNG